MGRRVVTKASFCRCGAQLTRMRFDRGTWRGFCDAESSANFPASEMQEKFKTTSKRTQVRQSEPKHKHKSVSGSSPENFNVKCNTHLSKTAGASCPLSLRKIQQKSKVFHLVARTAGPQTTHLNQEKEESKAARVKIIFCCSARAKELARIIAI